MGKASNAKQNASRRDRIAAQRAAQRRREARNRILIFSGIAVVVVAVVLVFVIIKLNAKSPSTTASNGPTGAALAAVVADTTSVPTSTLEKVEAGSVTSPPSAISGTPLTAGGKPEMLYIGAEYCPYCAFERWGMIVALSRFGSFSGLSTVHSSSTDQFPNTPTWTFYKSSYTSKYLTFTTVEQTTNVPDSSSPLGYVPLQSLTAAQQALLTKYGQNGAIPFVNFGNKYVINGASASPQLLHGLSWATIASDLKNTSSPVAQAINGTASYMTAAICKLTGDQPATACTPTITALQSKM